MIHNKNISRWVEFAPISNYGIWNRTSYMRETNIPTTPFTCGVNIDGEAQVFKNPVVMKILKFFRPSYM